MPFQAYLVSQYEHSHENIFFRDLVKLLDQIFKTIHGEHILIGNVSVEGHPLDAIFIKNGLITVIDFKNYGGILTFSENNAWRIVNQENQMSFVKGGSKFLNPYQQVKAYRFALVEYLEARKNKILEVNHTKVNWSYIGATVLFHREVKYQSDTIPGSIKKYFHIHSAGSLPYFLKDSYTAESSFSDVEIHRILIELNVTNENKYSKDIVLKDIDVKPYVKIPQSRLKLISNVLDGSSNDTMIKKALKFYETLLKLESHLDSNISDETSYVVSFDKENGFLLNITSVESFYKKYLLNSQENFPKNIFVGLNICINGIRYPLFYTIIFKHEIKDERAHKIDYEHLELNRKILEILELDESTIDELSSKLNQQNTLELKIHTLNDYLGELSLVTDSVSVGFSNENIFSSQVISEIKKLADFDNKINDHNLFKKFLLNESLEQPYNKFDFKPFVQVTKLNSSQKKAVQLSFENPITVVTGPPGTGKTQVVLNIIANAIVNEKTILFASKNNKAVDNVIQRFHSLCENDYLLRFGTRTDVSSKTKVTIETFLNNRSKNSYLNVSINLNNRKQELITKQNRLLDITYNLELIPKYRSEIDDLEGIIKEKEKILMLIDLVLEFYTNLKDQVNKLPDTELPLNDKFIMNSINNSDYKLDNNLIKIGDGLNILKEKILEANKKNELLLYDNYVQQNNLNEWINALDANLKYLFIENNIVFQIDNNVVANLINKIQFAKKGFLHKLLFSLFVRKRILKKIKIVNSELPDLAKALVSNSAPYIQPGINFLDSFNNNLQLIYLLVKEGIAIHIEREKKIKKIKIAFDEILNNINNINTVISNSIKDVKIAHSAVSADLIELKVHRSTYQDLLEKLLNEEMELKKEYDEIQNQLPILGTDLLALSIQNRLFEMKPDRVQRYLNFIPFQLWKKDELKEFDICSSDFIKDFSAVSVTSLSIKNGFSLYPKLFDMLVIDEASQCDIASALPLIFRAKKIVVIGDNMQLKHITAVKEYEEKYLEGILKIEQMSLSYVKSSLFDYCKNIANQSKYDTVFLNEHYRCHPEIISYSDYHFYKKLLGQELEIKTRKEHFKLSPSGLHWVDIKGVMTIGLNVNELEARKCIDLARQLLRDHPNATIGIITPFKSQYERIFKLMDSNLRDKVKVDTVHKYQGDEKDIIILSLVLTEGCKQSLANFINIGSPYLLNVAITRAKNTLYIVGNATYCRQLLTRNKSKTLLKHLVEHADSLHKIKN